MSELKNNDINTKTQIENNNTLIQQNHNPESNSSPENIINNESSESQSEDFYPKNGDISSNFDEDIKKVDNMNKDNKVKNDTLKFDIVTQECQSKNNELDKSVQSSSKKIKNYFIFYSFGNF